VPGPRGPIDTIQQGPLPGNVNSSRSWKASTAGMEADRRGYFGALMRCCSVTSMISKAIRKVHAAGIKIGICGQGPSNHPDFAVFLVGEGIGLRPYGFVSQERAA